MSDLLDRLQDAQLDHNAFRWGWLAEAADRIRELEAKVARLNEAYELARQDCINLTEKVLPKVHDRMNATDTKLRAIAELPEKWYSEYETGRRESDAAFAQRFADELEALLKEGVL